MCLDYYISSLYLLRGRPRLAFPRTICVGYGIRLVNRNKPTLSSDFD